jgi:hypothetical protein
MAWKNVISPLAVTSRRRVVASAVMYGLSLTVRFTSAAGDETEIPAQAAQSTNPMTAIMINDGAQTFYKDWPPKSAQPIVFQRGWPLGASGCRTACESRMPISSMPNCSSHP